MKRGRGDSWFKKSSSAGRAQSNSLHYPELLPQPQITDIDSIDHQNLNQEARGLIMKIGDMKIIAPKATSSTNPTRAAEKPKKLLSFVMEDETGSINVLMWGDNVDKYEHLVQVGYVVSVKNAMPKERSKFPNASTSHLELHVQSHLASIELVPSPEADRLYYAVAAGPTLVPTPIAELPNIYQTTNASNFDSATAANAKVVNVVGVLARVSQLVDVVTKDGGKTQKLTVLVYDHTERSFEVSFWGSSSRCISEQFRENESVLLFTSIRLSSWGGHICGSFSHESLLYTAPTCGKKLALWSQKNRRRLECIKWEEMQIQPIAVTDANGNVIKNDKQSSASKKRISLHRLQISSLGGQSVLFASVLGLIRSVGPDPATWTHTECPECKKRVDPNQKECSDPLCKSRANVDQEFHPKLTCSVYVSISDHSGSLDRISLNNDASLALLGLSSVEELSKLSVEERRELISRLFWRRVLLSVRYQREGNGKLSVHAYQCELPKAWDQFAAMEKAHPTL